MTSHECHAKLNELLIRLNRSLLQYVGESWPWIDSESPETLAELDGMVKRQQNDVSRLVQVLMSRRWAIEFSNYATEFTDKHFLSLDFLLPQIVADEKRNKAVCDDALACCGEESDVAELLKQIKSNETDGIDRLERMLKNRQKKPATTPA